jgi:hypothetical protein
MSVVFIASFVLVEQVWVRSANFRAMQPLHVLLNTPSYYEATANQMLERQATGRYGKQGL